MPAYEYRCSKYGHRFEVFMPINGPMRQRLKCQHPRCRQMADRVFGWASTHYHGAGFYTTDVKGRTERKRRPNVGDDLARAHDPVAAAIVE